MLPAKRVRHDRLHFLSRIGYIFYASFPRAIIVFPYHTIVEYSTGSTPATLAWKYLLSITADCFQLCTKCYLYRSSYLSLPPVVFISIQIVKSISHCHPSPTVCVHFFLCLSLARIPFPLAWSNGT